VRVTQGGRSSTVPVRRDAAGTFVLYRILPNGTVTQLSSN
jgi:hypothetical protein